MTVLAHPLGAALYTALIALSCLGYGYAILNLPGIRQPPGWGLSALSGFSFIVVCGGIFSLFGTVTEGLNFAVVIAGVLVLFWMAFVRVKRKGLPGLRLNVHYIESSIIFLSVLLIGLNTAGAFYPHWQDVTDDWLAYFVFPQKMLDTGTLVEPFNLRRIGGLGGASYVHTLLWPMLYTSATSVMDLGLGTFLLWASSREVLKPYKPPGYLNELMGLMAVVFANSLIASNHFPVRLPMALFTALIALFIRLCHEGRLQNLRALIPPALAAGALISMRNNFVIYVFLIALFSCFFTPRNGAIKISLKHTAGFIFFLVLTGVFAAPWMILCYQFNGTPFFPLFKGNYRFPGEIKKELGIIELGSFIFSTLWYTKAVLIVLMLPLHKVLRSRVFGAACFVAATAALSVAITASQLTAGSISGIFRYSEPFIVPSLITVFLGIFAGHLADQSIQAKKYNAIAKTLAVLIALSWFVLPTSREFTARHHSALSFSIKSQLNNALKLKGSSTVRDRLLENDLSYYRKAQKYLPKGAQVLLAVSKPYYVDFSLQRLDTLDTPGQVSPPPGMPFFKGGEAFRAYLDGLGYEYLLYTPPGLDMLNYYYSRRMWVENRINMPASIRERFSPYFINYFDMVRELELQGRVVYRNRYLRVLKLMDD